VISAVDESNVPRWIQGDPERAGRRVRMDWMKGNAATEALDQSLCNVSRVGLQCVCKCSPKIQYMLGARCVGTSKLKTFDCSRSANVPKVSYMLGAWSVGFQKLDCRRSANVWTLGASVNLSKMLRRFEPNPSLEMSIL